MSSDRQTDKRVYALFHTHHLLTGHDINCLVDQTNKAIKEDLFRNIVVSQHFYVLKDRGMDITLMSTGSPTPRELAWDIPEICAYISKLQEQILNRHRLNYDPEQYNLDDHG